MKGIDPKSIPYAFAHVAAELTEHPEQAVKDPLNKLLATQEGREWYEDAWGGYEQYFEWKDHWRRIDASTVIKAFTLEGAVRLWYAEPIASLMGDHIESKHFLLWKIRNSIWHMGHAEDYNMFVDRIESLKALTLDLPDFDLRLTHTRYYQRYSWAEHVDTLYLDAPLGLVIYYKGEHVLTVGFGVSRHGVQIAQIQLRKKKGNRFLYKLPKHYIDVVLDIFYNAFGDNVWLVQGASAVTAVKKAYGQSPCSMTPEDAVRIQALYDRELADFDRTSEVVEAVDRQYIRLVRRRVCQQAA